MVIAVISSYPFIKIQNNYGALLQYFALQLYLQSRGHKTYWIRNESFSQSFTQLIRRLLNYGSIRLMLYFLYSKLSFSLFIKRYLNVSEIVYSDYHALKESPPLADVYITGSDQVWGSTCLKENFLTFVPKHKLKVAYAASFGRVITDEKELATMKPWLQDFDAISIREDFGVKLCEEMEVKSIQLLDPTFLITANQYPTNSSQKSNYCYCYFLNVKNKDEVRWQSIKSFLFSNHIDYYITAIQGAELAFRDEKLCFASPQQWLTNYKYANLIFTNTFHGTVFAIIFHVPFVVILQEGASESQNGRLFSLLNIFSLENRIWSKDFSLDTIVSTPIDWNHIDEIQRLWISRSDVFLSKIGI